MGCEYNGSRMMVLWHLDRFQLNFIVTVRSSSNIIQICIDEGVHSATAILAICRNSPSATDMEILFG